MKILVLRRGEVDEEYEVEVLPRIGELVSGRSFSAARVQDVKHHLVSGSVTIWVQ
jgi:hypothetical protein